MSRPLRIYVSGPMTGWPDLNFPAFHHAARILRQAGWDVVNPAELNPDPTATWEECMRADIRAICDCTHMAMLPYWQSSRGARLERSLARRLGLVVDELHVMLWLPRDEQRRAA